MKDYVMFTLSKSPVKNWIDKGHVSTKYESPKLVFANAMQCPLEDPCPEV